MLDVWKLYIWNFVFEFSAYGQYFLVERSYMDRTDHIFLVESPYMDRQSVHFWKKVHICGPSVSRFLEEVLSLIHI